MSRRSASRSGGGDVIAAMAVLGSSRCVSIPGVGCRSEGGCLKHRKENDGNSSEFCYGRTIVLKIDQSDDIPSAMSHSLDTLDVPVTAAGRTLDDTDRQIVAFLQRDARMANAEIA